MIDTLFIDKEKIAETECDYDRFYKMGIEMLQKYAGDIWTDYNIHDPGVTILEQLCYALTELNYKSTFNVEDYFTENNGEIDYEQHGLLKPHECLSTACVTINDFRRVLFDDVAEVGNIWIEKDRGNIDGLYNVYVDIADQLEITDKLKKHVKDSIRESFVKNRNLSEDISEIIIHEREFCDLCGTIEVHTERPINEVYGEIYCTCSKYISSNLMYHSVKELFAAGMSLHEILDGPLLKKGILLETDLSERSRVIDISEMIAAIRNIDGVKEVHTLFIRCNDTKIFEETPYCENNKAKTLRIPTNETEFELLLVRNGKKYQPDPVIVSDEVYKQLIYDPYYPDYINDIQQLFGSPQGICREFNTYYSIQNDFPVAYGISFDGLSSSETPERKAKAKQLKAYLYFFEQIMADYLESIQNIKKLFSTNKSQGNTYFSKFLNNSNIPNIQELYVGEDRMPENLKLILGNYDDSLSRRSKILDYMLSMYGLELKQRSLRQFLTNEKDSTISHKIIQNKLRYLKYAALMTERSGKGINYLDSQPEINKLSGLELQILLRTGIEPSDRNCIENVLVIEHILLRPSIRNGKMEPDEFFRNSVTVFFPRFRGRYTNDQFQLLVMEIVEQYTPAHVYVNCVWCEQNEWNLIEPVYLKWCKSLLNKKESVDELSSQLVMLIKKMTERRSERAGQ
jgi:hypothetical protein